MTVDLALEDVVATDERAACRVLADPKLAYFQGHFPVMPILPAICQLEGVVLPLIDRAWPDIGSVRRLSRLKFRRPIVPGEWIDARVDRLSSSKIRFSVSVTEQVASSGLIEFGGAS